MPKKVAKQAAKECVPMELSDSRPPTPGGDRGERSKRASQEGEVTAEAIKNYLESQGEKVEKSPVPGTSSAAIVDIEEGEVDEDPLGGRTEDIAVLAQELQAFLAQQGDQQADRDDMSRTLINQGLNMLQSQMLRREREHAEMMTAMVGIRADMAELFNDLKDNLVRALQGVLQQQDGAQGQAGAAVAHQGQAQGQAPQGQAPQGQGNGQHGGGQLPGAGQGAANYLPGVMTTFTEQDIDISSRLERMDPTTRQRSLRNWRKWVKATILNNNTIAMEFRGVLDKGPYPNKIKDNNICMANPCLQRVQNRCLRWHGCGQCAVFLLQMGREHNFLSQSCPLYSALTRGLRADRLRRAR